MPGSPARSEQRLKTRTVTGGNTDTYDAHGTLVKRANADGTSTVYIGGIYEAAYDAGGALTGTTKYYQAFGRTIAMRSSSVAACASAPCYPLTDHLGSTVGMTDNSGNVLSTQKYWPYGAVRSGSVTQTDKLYTGQQIENGDSALGLYNYKARFYSTTLGRFASADSWSGDGLNRYAYTRNNPLRYDDPTGHGAVGIPGPGCVEDTPGDGSCDPAPAVDPLEWANTVPAPSPIVPEPPPCPTVDEAPGGLSVPVVGVAVAVGVAEAVGGEAVGGAVAPLAPELYCAVSNCGGKLYDATRDLVHKGLGTLFGKTTGKNPDKAGLAKQLDTGQDQGWDKVSERTEPAVSASYPGGTSKTTRYRNRYTGKELDVHELFDADGKSHGHRNPKDVD